MRLFLSIFLVTSCYFIHAQPTQSLSVLWKTGSRTVTIDVRNGSLNRITMQTGHGTISRNRIRIKTTGPFAVALHITSLNAIGPQPTIITITDEQSGFSFMPRDVSKTFPIYIPAYGVAVVPENSFTSYDAVARHISSLALTSTQQQLESAGEESFDLAALHTRNQRVPTWLGLSRDMRIFQVSEALDNGQEFNLITPFSANTNIPHPTDPKRNLVYNYMFGRGQGVQENVSRQLVHGYLPMLQSTLIDGDIQYKSVQFVSLATATLTKTNVKGTHYLVADQHSGGSTLSPEHQQQVAHTQHSTDPHASPLFVNRTSIVNTGAVPTYAWLRTARPGRGWWDKIKYQYDNRTGYSGFSNNNIFCITHVNGQPAPNEELAILLQPGDSAIVEFFIPHSPVDSTIAKSITQQSSLDRMRACINYWQTKFPSAAVISLPETRIEQMLRAGLSHLDLVTYGNEPDSTVAPCIGVYSPIGTESAPIIQFYNSMGLYSLARRSLQFFLEKQYPDGLMQNFGGYMVETGAVLWSIGEYMRYTHDTAWLQTVKNKVLLSCKYLLDWRNRNKIDSLKSKGYGMISGKVADPEDHFHQFMLNGYANLGISRIAEALSVIDPKESARLRTEADAWKQDIRDALFYSMKHSPVVPLRNGTWVPSVPPWTEAISPRALYTENENFVSHGTVTVSDALLGPLYLVFTEILSPQEQSAQFMLDYHRDLFYHRNSAFSQPYYSRHNWMQLALNEVKPFLKTYYNTMAALADRQTYTFWEHIYHVTPHKTHEEAWFLMETRWMLWMEEKNTLHLFKGIPKKWLEDGQSIELKNIASYFGKLNVSLTSGITRGFVDVSIEFLEDRLPETVKIRIPHPGSKTPNHVSAGRYDTKSETVIISSPGRKINLRISF